MNFWFHIPWYGKWKNDNPVGNGRTYLRFEYHSTNGWASAGRNADQTLRIYRREREYKFNFTVCQGKIDYPLTWDDC